MSISKVYAKPILLFRDFNFFEGSFAEFNLFNFGNKVEGRRKKGKLIGLQANSSANFRPQFLFHL